MKTVDLSSQAVTRRLRQVDDLRALCLALAGPRLKRPWGVPPPPTSPVEKGPSATCGSRASPPTSPDVPRAEPDLKTP